MIVKFLRFTLVLLVFFPL